MKMESRIALQSMKYHKSKNILIGIAIFLTTLLLFLIPSIGKGLVDAQYAAVNHMYPSFHALFRNVDVKTAEKLAVHHEISTYGLRSDAGYMATEEADIGMIYFDKTGLALYNVSLLEGALPRKENEIVVSKGILAALGQTGAIGDTITVPYQIDRGEGLDYTQEKEFTISGFLKDASSNRQQKQYTALISKKFLEMEVPEESISYRFLLQTNAKKEATTTDIEETVADIAQQFGIEDKNVRINDEYLSANYIDPITLPVIIAIMCIVMLAGIITIYSIYYVGMSARIQEFGRLKALGATKKQLKKIVLREGYFVAGIAIPLGLFVGTFATKGIFQLLLRVTKKGNNMMSVVDDLLQSGEITLFHVSIYLLAAVVTLLTVWLSLRKPMSIAAKVSEIEAIRFQGNDSRKKQKQRRKSYTDLGIFRIAKIYMLGNKRNTVLTIGAMSITGIFVMVVSSILSCANPVESANQSILGQYTIRNAEESGNKEHPEREWKNIILDNPLNDDLMHKIEMVDGVQDVIAFEEINVTYEQMDGGTNAIAGIPEQYAQELIDGIVEGKVTYEALQSGDQVVVDKNLLRFYPDIKVGDTLRLQIPDGTKDHSREVTVAAIGDYPISLTNFCGFLMAQAGTEKLCSSNVNGMIHVFAEESYDPDTEQAIKEIISGNELLQMETWKKNYDDWKAAIALTSGGCYAFLGVLGIICIMNMINTMIHNVHLRKKEIGMMQAVGMSDRQLTRLLQIEGLFYTVGTLVMTIGIGSLAGYPVFLWARKNGMFNIRQYHYPVTAAVIVVIVLFVIQMLLAVVLSRSVKKESLIERVRYAER